MQRPDYLRRWSFLTQRLPSTSLILPTSKKLASHPHTDTPPHPHTDTPPHPHTDTSPHSQIATKPRKKSQKGGEEGDNKGRKKRVRGDTQPATKRPKLKPGDPGYDPYDFTSDEDEDPDESHDIGGESLDQLSKSGDQVEEMDTEPTAGGHVELREEK